MHLADAFIQSELNRIQSLLVHSLGIEPMTYCLNWWNSSALLTHPQTFKSLHAGPVAQTVAQGCGFDAQVMHELIKCMH